MAIILLLCFINFINVLIFVIRQALNDIFYTDIFFILFIKLIYNKWHFIAIIKFIIYFQLFMNPSFINFMKVTNSSLKLFLGYSFILYFYFLWNFSIKLASAITNTFFKYILNYFYFAITIRVINFIIKFNFHYYYLDIN